MKECSACGTCFPDDFNNCPNDGGQLKFSLRGDLVLDERYKLERRLGRGGMGIVFKASHLFLKSTHAVKVILPDLAGQDPMLVTRFRQEAIVAASIRHKNIVMVTDFGVANETMPFLVMEFLVGGSLWDLLVKRRRLSSRSSLEIMEAVGAGVSAAHRRNIVHRDLKPLNIFIQEGMPISEGLKVLDFGLAKIKSGEGIGSFIQAQTTSPMGSPLYMAPEQWSEGEPDSRADIYSIGVMLYQMLAGEVPFGGSSMPKIMRGHLMSPPPAFAELGVDVSPAVEAVVRHALEKEPEARPSTVDEFVAELREAVSKEGPELRSSAPSLVGAEDETATLPRTRRPLTGFPSGSDLTGSKTRAFEETQRQREDEADQLLRELEEAQRRAEEARRRVEEAAERRAAEEAERRQAEAEAARKQLEEEEALRRAAEEEQKRAEEEQARKLAQEEEARKLAEEEAQRKAAEEQARKLAEEEANRLSLEVEEARRRAEEARIRAEEEAQGRAKEEAARKSAEERAARLAREVEEAQQRAEEARLRAEEEARKRAEEEAARRQAEEARARKRAASEVQRLAEEEEARLRAKAEADRLAQEVEEAQRRAEEARLRAEAEAGKRIEEEAARKRAEEEATRLQKEVEQARKRVEEELRKIAEEATRKRAEEAAALLQAKEAAARRVIDEELKKRAEETERQRAAEEAIRRRAEEEEARKRAESHALRLAEEEEARRRAEEEANRLALEIEEARRLAEEAQRDAEEEARKRAEQERVRREEEEAARLRAKEDADRLARLYESARRRADEARQQAEEEARKRSEEATARKAAEEKALRLEREVEEAKRRAEEARVRVEEEVRSQGQAEEARRREEEGVRAAEIEQRRKLQEQIQFLEEEKRRREQEIVTAELGARVAAGLPEAGRETMPVLVSQTDPTGLETIADYQTQSASERKAISLPEDQTVAARRESIQSRPAHAERKYLGRVLVGLALLVLVLGSAGYGVYYYMQRSTPAPEKKPEAVKPNLPVDNLVKVPGGTFMMGRNDVAEQDPQWPAHSVPVKDFLMDRYEVTQAEYAQFVQQSSYQPPKGWSGTRPAAGHEQWPVTDVSLDDARSFAIWRSTRDGVKYRLPTEEEWEYAARSGNKNYLYPWGNAWFADRANLGTGQGAKVDSPKAVGSYPQGASDQGILDLIGNVWEWTSSEASLYPGNTSTLPESKRGQFVMRGGSHQSLDPAAVKFRKSQEFPATFRQWFPRETRSNTLGFRLVRDPS